MLYVNFHNFSNMCKNKLNYVLYIYFFILLIWIIEFHDSPVVHGAMGGRQKKSFKQCGGANNSCPGS